MTLVLIPILKFKSWTDSTRQSRCLFICAWFLKCQFGSLLQTRKKIAFEANSIFCWVRTWFLQATQAVKIKFELEKKSSWFWTRFFSEFEINCEIQNSKIECREIGRLFCLFTSCIYLPCKSLEFRLKYIKKCQYNC